MGWWFRQPVYACNSLPVLLLLVFVITQLCLTLISASTVQRHAGFDKHVSDEVAQPSPGVLKPVREFKLVHRCSHKYVQIIGSGNRVNAKGDPESEFTPLLFETESFESRLRISSAKSHNYLCFNKKGKPVVRHSGKSKLCIFKEELKNGYTQLRSAHRDDWLLGFKCSGGRLKGDDWKKKKKKRKGRRHRHSLHSFQFQKDFGDRDGVDENAGNIDLGLRKQFDKFFSQKDDKT